MEINLKNNISNNKKDTTADKLVKDLKEHLEQENEVKVKNEKEYNFVDQSERYKHYWADIVDLTDNVCAILGISRYDSEIKYADKLFESVEKSIFKIAKMEKSPLYLASGPFDMQEETSNGKFVNRTVYDVTKYENGKSADLKSMKLPGFPKNMDKNGNWRNIIFQMDEDGKTTIREDLKEEILKLACEKCAKLKEQTEKERDRYKKEGHLYEVNEFDGSIFLDDVTEENYSFEDIDFVVDNYKGEGTYKVINGQYKKISDEFDIAEED